MIFYFHSCISYSRNRSESLGIVYGKHAHSDRCLFLGFYQVERVSTRMLIRNTQALVRVFRIEYTRIKEGDHAWIVNFDLFTCLIFKSKTLIREGDNKRGEKPKEYEERQKKEPYLEGDPMEKASFNGERVCLAWVLWDARAAVRGSCSFITTMGPIWVGTLSFDWFSIRITNGTYKP